MVVEKRGTFVVVVERGVTRFVLGEEDDMVMI